MDKKTSRLSCWRVLYILDVDNMGVKSKFYGLTKCLYPGQTIDIGHRMKEHLQNIGCKFLSTNFRDARRKLVFVDYMFGTEDDVSVEEDRFKALKRSQKLKLIESDRNKLVAYKPCKAIILKKNGNESEQVCIKL